MPEGDRGMSEKAYSRYGNCYRIGGDEFCVLFREPEKEKYCREKFYWIIEKRKKSPHMLPVPHTAVP